jgi:hypothetical protein
MAGSSSLTGDLSLRTGRISNHAQDALITTGPGTRYSLSLVLPLMDKLGIAMSVADREADENSLFTGELANRSLIFQSILVTLQLDDKRKNSSSSQTFVKQGGQVCKKRDRKRQVLPEHPVSSQQSSPTQPRVVMHIMPPTWKRRSLS